MSGRLYVVPKGTPRAPYERVRLTLDGGEVFVFLDVRKFGRFTFAEELEGALPELGPEPLGDEFRPEWFRRALRRTSRQLKPLLLDQSFVAGIGRSREDEAITAAILAMAQNLGIRVVAEGIETEEQLEFLKERKCDEIQGFLVSRPLALDRVGSFLEDYGS